MNRGIRAEIAIGDPGACPLGALTAGEQSALTDATWCDCSGTTGGLLEFTGPAGVGDGVGREHVTTVFETGEYGRYRVPSAEAAVDRERERESTAVETASDGGGACPCTVLQARGYPVTDLRAEGGTLSFTVYVRDSDEVRAVVETLRRRFEGVSVRSLTTDGDGSPDDPVVVDRSQLTGRQREALETAHEMGYFARRRQATGEDVADALDISLSTFTEHVGAGLDKVLSQLFAEP